MRWISGFSALVVVSLTACATSTRIAILPSRPIDRHGHSVAFVDDTLYVLGGFAADQSSDPDRGCRDFLAIDLESGAWRGLASLERPLAAGAACVVDDDLYAIGGGVVARYDMGGDRWITITVDGAIPNSHLSAAVHDGAIVVVGGFPFRESTVLRVSIADGSVTPMTPPPGFAKGDHFVFTVVLRGRLHLLGGIRESEVFERHWSFEAGSWREEPPLPVAAFTKFAAYGVVDDVLYAWDGARLSHAFDPRSRAWSEVESWPETLAMPACVTIDETIHVLGGLPLGDEIHGERRELDRPFDAANRVWRSASGE